jgi:predicted small secreted protein
MSIRSLVLIRNSPIIEVLVKTVAGASVMLGACNTVDWLGAQIFRHTGRSLMNSTPRPISKGIHQFFGQTLAPINQYFERRNPLVGRIIVAPVLEEMVFRGIQTLLLSYVMGPVSRIALSSLLFDFAHNEAQPGKNLVLLFVGIILGCLAEWNESILRGLLTAILAHAIFNALITYIYVQILKIGI